MIKYNIPYNTLTIICHFFSKIQKTALHVMIIVQLLSQNNIL